MATDPDDTTMHDVHRGLALVAAGLDLVSGASGLSMGNEEVREALAQITGLTARCRSAYLQLLAASAQRDDPSAPGTRDGAETTGWLADRARMSAGRVRRDLREAEALDPESGPLRALGQELSAGTVTPEHASIAVRALDQLPARVLRTRREEVDALLTRHAKRFAPPITKKLARHLLDTLDPARADRFDAEAHLRREAYLGTDSTGMGVLRATLEPAATAHLKAVLDHLSAPHRGQVKTEDDRQAALPVADERTPAQRRADALGEMARLAAGSLTIGVRAGEPPRVVVHTTPEQVAAARRHRDATASPAGAATCEQTGPLTAATLALLACDAVVDRVLLREGGRVLAMTSLGRLFSAAQRRALAARDGGCAFPGCDRPPAWTDAHHVVFWSDGGPTTVENGVLLCGPHHTTVHLGEWEVVMRHGVPWFVPPRRLDPCRRRLRNTVHEAVAATRRAAQQLHLDLPPPVDVGPDG